MTEPDRLSERALRRLDDLQLEAVRLDLLRSGDERYELVVEQLLLRAITTIERTARELCELPARAPSSFLTPSSTRPCDCSCVCAARCP